MWRGIVSFRVSLVAPGIDELPEDEQYETYKLLGEAAGEYGAIVRLFDVGGEVGPDMKERERNPALGLRAVRFNLRHKQIMRTQVRAILRRRRPGRLSLVIPMMADVADVRMAKRVIDEESNVAR